MQQSPHVNTQRRPISLIVERALRFLRLQARPVDSVRLASELLATSVPDEATASGLLKQAFAGDPRLLYGKGGWRPVRADGDPPQLAEPDRVLIVLQGSKPSPGRAFELRHVSVLRLRNEEVVAACEGHASRDRPGQHLRRAVSEALLGAVPVIHDPPGALKALEGWLGEPLAGTISVRLLAQTRLGLRATHDLGSLAQRLGIVWRDMDDPLEQADTLDACLRRLRKSDESLENLQLGAVPGLQPINWSRFAFNRSFLNRVPQGPGTYRFLDAAGGLLYVGKSKNLKRRIASYFQEGRRRSRRVQLLLDHLHHIEFEYAGSELEAMLREAAQIRRAQPQQNVQRQVHVREGRAARLRSILILEQAAPPSLLRAYLIRQGRLIARVAIGRRGGGLKRIERFLDDHFFFVPQGPSPAVGPDLDVEVVVRWLAANRDRVVAFDPTDLLSAREVTDRLRWFLAQPNPLDPEGPPIHQR